MRLCRRRRSRVVCWGRDGEAEEFVSKLVMYLVVGWAFCVFDDFSGSAIPWRLVGGEWGHTSHF